MSAANVIKALEGAVAATIVATADLAKLPRLRTWQAVDIDNRWSPQRDRVFPLYELRASPPRLSEEDGATLLCPVNIQISTKIDDDKTHAEIEKYYAAAQQVIDNLYAQYRSGTPGSERLAFNAHLADQEPAVNALINIGGFSHGDGLDPFEEDGVNNIGVTLIIHYSRNDY
jgi:hypothetical protein